MQEAGGFEQVTLNNKWSYVATEKMRMSNIPGSNVGNKLKSNYEKYLYPYDLFEAGVTTDLESTKPTVASVNGPAKSPNEVDENSPALSILVLYT